MIREQRPATTYQARVYCVDTDMLGCVYYSRFFEYFEAARWFFFSASGMEDKRVIDLCNRTLVIEAGCRYLSKVYFGDTISVSTKLTTIDDRRYRADFEVMVDGCSVATGYTIQITISSTGGSPVNIPTDIRDFEV